MNKSVFISYRRSVSGYFARAVFQDLRQHKFDVFMDVQSIDAGQFDTIILDEIAARPYFLLVLTPGSLERCVERRDWLLREINHAMKLKRKIVPLVSHDFDFADAKKFLKGPLATELPRYNAVQVPHNYFEEAMKRLRMRFLKLTDIPVTPLTYAVETEARKAKAPTPKPIKSTSNRVDKKSGRQHDIEVHESEDDSARGHFQRGIAFRQSNDLDNAILEYTMVIKMYPSYADVYINRGIVYSLKKDYRKAIADFKKSLSLNPSQGQAQEIQKDIDKWSKKIK